MTGEDLTVLLRGGGDLASGVALRLHRAGMGVLITEIPQPLAVRRLVSFAEAVYESSVAIEGVTSVLANDLAHAREIMNTGSIPVLVDPAAKCLAVYRPLVLVDARMTKRPPELGMDAAPFVVGLGPGFVAGENCHAAVETRRGHTLGRVIWHGPTQPDTGTPEAVLQEGAERVLRAPAAGVLRTHVAIGDRVVSGQVIADVDGRDIQAPFRGVVRGLLRPGMVVQEGMKVGDLDPRGNPEFATLVSDKSLAVGGGVVEAILSRPELRRRLRL